MSSSKEAIELSGTTQWIFFASQANRSYPIPSLARELAQISTVIMVRRPISFLQSRGRHLRFRDRFSLPNSEQGYSEYFPIHFPQRLPWIGTALKFYGNRKLATELDRILKTPSSTIRIACYDSPTQHSLVGTLKEDLSVYLAIDDRTVTVWGKPIPGELEAERKLLERVDHVVCVSQPLANTLRLRAGAREDLKIHVLSNGYDNRLFSPELNWNEPAELSTLPRPRILVTGHVSERIDWDGIRGAATLRPNWSWIFVGPADKGMAERIESIHKETTAPMFLFAPVQHEAIPAWIAHCDACAVPYRLNSFTLASSPLKGIECLGAGAPLLATRVPALKQFGDVVFWVEESDSATYVSALDSLSQQERFGTAAARRQKAVQTESWEHKARQFCMLIESALVGRRISGIYPND
jgi:glycosyltransferase involved in cell wall biosynthesis